MSFANWFDWKWLVALVLLLFGLSAGCLPKNTSINEQEAGVERAMVYIDKAAGIAKEHGLAYSATLDVTGKPAVGEDLSFYFDTGVRVRVTFTGNAAGR